VKWTTLSSILTAVVTWSLRHITAHLGLNVQ